MTPLEHVMGLIDPSYSESIRRAVAQGVLDKHAHDLAEKIRGLQKQDHDHIDCVPCFVYGEAADLIDPEKECNDPQ